MSDIDDKLAAMCKATDATLISNVGQIPMFLDVGAKRCFYTQIGLDWDEDVLGLPAWDPPFQVPEVVFIGNYYQMNGFERGTAERLDAIRFLLSNRVQVGVVGSGWPPGIPVYGQCHVKQQHHVYKRAKVALSINHFNQIDRYYSDRQLIAMASGTPTVCWAIPGLDKEFERDTCVPFSTHDDLLDAVTTLLNDRESAQFIGECGRTFVMQHHTWKKRVENLLPTIQEIAKEL